MALNNIEEVKKQLGIFLDILEKEPNVAREILKKSPDIGNLLIYFLSATLKEKDEMSKNIPKLLQRYLGSINPYATVLCLGSGTGIEFVQIRKLVPKGRIIGIDNSSHPEVTGSTVINEFRAKAEFYPLDLNQVSPEELTYQLGEMP